MGDLNEFTRPVKLFLKSYPWRRIDPVPWTPLRKALAECRVALITSAGFVAPGQDRFDESKRGGDVSFREIPTDIDLATLIDCQRSGSFDHDGMRRDPNLAFPLDRIQELAAAGESGQSTDAIFPSWARSRPRVVSSARQLPRLRNCWSRTAWT